MGNLLNETLIGLFFKKRGCFLTDRHLENKQQSVSEHSSKNVIVSIHSVLVVCLLSFAVT